MSIGFCGMIYLSTNNVKEHVELAYYIQQKAIDYKLGCKLGGNVSEDVYNLYEEKLSVKTILFELMDTPLDNYANTIFQPTIDSEDNYEDCFASIMEHNMSKIKEFFHDILENGIIEKIVVDVNYLFKENKKVIDISIAEFNMNIINQYINNNYFTPDISYCIKK